MASIKPYYEEDGKIVKYYRAQITLSRDRNGHYPTRNKRFKRKADAERWAAEQLLDKDNYRPEVNSKILFGEWLDIWIKEHSHLTISPRTAQEYRKLIEKYIKPQLGIIRLAQLTRDQIRAYYVYLSEDGSLKERKKDRNDQPIKIGLSRTSILHHHTLIHKALEDAVGRVIKFNPADRAALPMPQSNPIKTFTAQEIDKIIEAFAGTPYQLAVAIAAFTGMRQGEVCGLQWQDIDLEARKIHLQRAVEYTVRGGLRLKPPKTESGRRQIGIDSDLAFALMLEKGNADPEGFVVKNSAGEMLSPSTIQWVFTKRLREIGIKHGSFHTLRHTHATIMLQEGVSPKVIQERLGHSKVSTTLGIYSHVTTDMQTQAVDAFKQAISRTRKVKEE